VAESVYAWAYKVKAVNTPLVVQKLELVTELIQYLVSLAKVHPYDLPLVDGANTRNELAEVLPILLREEAVE
jgi:hypothetical protein